MATEKRIAANRKNAQKSTGPRTTAGKARSRRNALKHGLAGEGIVLSAPDQKRVTQRIADDVPPAVGSDGSPAGRGG